MWYRIYGLNVDVLDEKADWGCSDLRVVYPYRYNGEKQEWENVRSVYSVGSMRRLMREGKIIWKCGDEVEFMLECMVGRFQIWYRRSRYVVTFRGKKVYSSGSLEECIRFAEVNS